MSFIHASSNRDLLAVLGGMVVAMFAVLIRARARVRGRDGAADAGASEDDDAAGGEAH
jgi:hypothetical protein